ncbi:MAG: hypothetical protein JNK54_05070 [Elusimicrobia bacterium]|nr:hypothetical protein [Elusimicrobiota bacterium]
MEERKALGGVWSEHPVVLLRPYAHVILGSFPKAHGISLTVIVPFGRRVYGSCLSMG